jgi:hypothetical protein
MTKGRGKEESEDEQKKKEGEVKRKSILFIM